MRILTVFVAAIILLNASCSQNAGSPTTSEATADTTQPAENTEITVPGIDTLHVTDTIRLQANDNMRFNTDLWRVKAGTKLSLILKNTAAKSGTSMVHNVVILNNGVDIADFADVAHTAKSEQYVPVSLSTSVIAHTNLVGGGDSAKIEFTLPKAGVYHFICSYPGHWGTMQGRIVAE